MADVSIKMRTAEPAARARRQFRWQPGGKPVAVHFDLDLIERLSAEVVENFRAVTARGSEIGGLLLGRVEGEPVRTVVVEDFELVPCDYDRGPLYQLTDADSARLHGALGTRRPGTRRAVGYFRSHTRKRLAPDADDAAIFNAHFPAGHDVFLLVRPFVKEPNLGAVYLGPLAAGAAAEESFPFEAAELLRPPYAAQVAEALPSPPEARPPAPVIRISEAKPAAERAPKEPPANAAAPPPSRPPAPAPAAPEPRSEPEPEARPKPLSPPEPAPPTASRRGLPWIAAAALAVCLSAGWYLFGPRRQAPAAAPVSGEPTLRVERSAGQLLLTWDRDAAWVRSARKAVLSIFDGTQKEDVLIDLGQLKTGSIVYLPVTNDVSFRMEVTNADSGRLVVESVRVLGTRPSPMPLDAPPAAQAGNVAVPNPAAGAPQPASPEAPPAVKTAKFTPPPGSLAARLRPAEPGDLPEPPTIADASAPAVPGLPVKAPAPLPAPARPAAPPAQTVAPAAIDPPAVTTHAVASDPVLLRRVDPVYPPIAKQARINGTVRMQVAIGKDGRVKNVVVMNGHALLRQAAVDAARQWIYRPSLLNGQPVESNLAVQIVFTLSH